VLEFRSAWEDSGPLTAYGGCDRVPESMRAVLPGCHQVHGELISGRREPEIPGNDDDDEIQLLIPYSRSWNVLFHYSSITRSHDSVFKGKKFLVNK